MNRDLISGPAWEGFERDYRTTHPAVMATKQATRGEQVIGSLFPNRGIGWPGGWSQDRLNQVMHFKNWTYVAINAIAGTLAQIMPNMAHVHHSSPHHRQRKRKSGADYRSADEMTWRYRSISHQGSRFSIPSYYTKALSVIKPHEELSPLAADDPLRRLIENPNPMDTPFDLLYELDMFLELCGVAYLWVVPNRWGVPCEMYVLPSHWVWPRTGTGEQVTAQNPYADRLIEYYEVRPWGGMGSARSLKFPPDEVIMFPWKHPLNKLDGFSRLFAVSQWIDVEESIGRCRWFQMINQARSELWIELGEGYEDPDDNRIARVEAKFMNKFSGESNFGKPIIGPPGARAIPLTFSPSEMAYMQSEDQVRDMILSAFGVPPSAVGLVKEMTYGSILATLAQMCLDEETECLTANGWVKHQDINETTRVACYDEGTERIVYRVPEKITRFNYSGPMHKWKAEGLDVLVTPAHRMYVKRYGTGKKMGKNWQIKTADELAGTTTFYSIKQAAKAACVSPMPVEVVRYKRHWTQNHEVDKIETINPEVWLEFLGYFISEGNLASRKKDQGYNPGWRITITQGADSSHNEKIEACLAKLPWQFVRSHHPKGNSYNWSTQDKGLWEHLQRHCGKGSINKKIPEYVKAWPAESLQILLDALVVGDGTKPTVKKGVWHCFYSTISQQLRDDVQEIATKCGFRANLLKGQMARSGNWCWNVGISSRSERVVLGHQRTVVNYTGKVWCLTVPTGLFVVRRNGTVHVTGNCITCLNPRLTMLGQRLTKFLGTRFSSIDDPIRIWWDDATPPDPQQLNADVALDAQHGAITTNEIRALRGRPPYEHGGDDPLLPGPGGTVPYPLNTGKDQKEFAAKVPMLGQPPMPPGGAPPGAPPGAMAPAGPPLPPEQQPFSPDGPPGDGDVGSMPDPEALPSVFDAKIDEPNGDPQKTKEYVNGRYLGFEPELVGVTKAPMPKPGEAGGAIAPQAPQTGQPNYQPYMAQPAGKTSFFSSCTRDPHGHCLPRNASDAVGEDDPRAQQAEEEPPDNGKMGPLAEAGKQSFASIAAGGGTKGHAGAVAREWAGVNDGVSKLPKGLREIVRAVWAALRLSSEEVHANFVEGQKLADRVANRKSAGDEEWKRLCAVLSVLDVQTGQLLHPKLNVKTKVPIGCFTYLAYSEAPDPVKKAASASFYSKKAVSSASRVKELEHKADLELLAPKILEYVGPDDWYLALLLTALDEAKDINTALEACLKIDDVPENIQEP